MWKKPYKSSNSQHCSTRSSWVQIQLGAILSDFCMIYVCLWTLTEASWTLDCKLLWMCESMLCVSKIWPFVKDLENKTFYLSLSNTRHKEFFRNPTNYTHTYTRTPLLSLSSLYLILAISLWTADKKTSILKPRTKQLIIYTIAQQKFTLQPGNCTCTHKTQ